MRPEHEREFIRILSEHPSTIKFFKNKYITDGMWRAAIKAEPAIFQYIVNPSHEIIKYALEEDGANIKYLSSMSIEITEEYLYIAIRNYAGAIFLVPRKLITSEIIEYALHVDPSIIHDLEKYDDYGTIIARYVDKDPTLIRFINYPTEDQICKAIKINPAICAYINHYTPRIIRTIQETCPEIINLIPKLKEYLQ